MPAIADTSAHPIGRAGDCSTAGNVTRSLLGYLALAGPFYVVASLTQAFTRSGFDPSRHEWSLLSVGHLGWIQTANLILTGAMIVIGAVGVRRAIGPSGVGRRWALRLLAGYGVALAAAGLFRPGSRAVGFAFALAFAGIASGTGNVAINLVFTAAVIASSAWLTWVAVDLYRGTRRDDVATTQASR